MKTKLPANICFFAALAATSSTALAQFTWSNWAYPNSTTATTSAGGASVNLTVSGTNSGAVDTTDVPIMYQGNPFTQLSGDSVGAQNFGTTSFQMQLNFTGSTAGLVLAIGNIAHEPGFSGYQMTAFDANNSPIPLGTFGQFGNYDYTWTSGNQMFNDDLSITNTNGKFHVMNVAGQDPLNSDMLIFALPFGVDRIFVNLQNSTDALPDTINFMVSAPVPEPSTGALALIGGIVGLFAFRRRLRRLWRIPRLPDWPKPHQVVSPCGLCLLIGMTTSAVFFGSSEITRANTYQIDDGTAEFAAGNGNGGDLIALNEFPVTGGNNVITSISIAWGGPGDLSLNGLSYTAVLWNDPIPDGVPNDPPVVLGTVPGIISNSGTNTFVTTAFSSPITVLTANFYVGFIITNSITQSPAAADANTLLTGRSFIATNAPGAGDIYNLNNNDFGGARLFDPTWMVRADAVPEPSVYILLGVGLLFCCQRFLRHPAA